MPDEQKTEQPVETQAAEVEQEEPTEANQDTAHRKVHNEVAWRLADSGPKVRGLVLDHLAEQEIQKRKEAVLKVLGKIKEKEIELKKLAKSGTIHYTAGGAACAPVFTKEQMESIRKTREEVARLSSCLGLAFEKHDFGKLLDAANK